ncbi:hypothetical protein DVH24_021836 [Malus domestica]|uniref:Secreted protein n=1 Tax=Malus domestica TaxID=3750 RepID=A0A498IYK3_MALDO|nr:hypothetical protein DVH24_021836 [Malus domestica]
MFNTLSLFLFTLSLPSTSLRRATEIRRGSAAMYEIESCRSVAKITASLGFAARFKPPKEPSERLGGRLSSPRLTKHFGLNQTGRDETGRDGMERKQKCPRMETRRKKKETERL